MRTGGVYGFLAASPEQPRKPGEWQTYDITLVGRVVTVVQNGQTIIDKQEIPGITGGAWIVTKHCPDRAICRVVSWPRRFSEHHDYANEVIWSQLPYEAEITLDRASLLPLL
jgi:hypothetical protein